MATFKSFSVTTGSPVKIIDADGAQLQTFRVTVRSGGTVTFGEADVVAAEGPQLATGTPPPTMDFDVVDDDMWAIASGSTAVVDVLSWVSHSVD